MKKKTLMTKNMLAAYDLLGQLEMAAEEETPAMGLITGNPGLGKTTSAAWLFVKADGVLVTCDKVDTEASILRKLCREYGIQPPHGRTKLLDAVREQANRIGKPIFFDEADYISKKEDVLETIRGIYDSANVPMLLIGYAKLPTIMKTMPQLRGRIGGHVQLAPADMEDINLMATLADVHVKDDLLKVLLQDTGGNFRDIRTGLSRIEKFAQTNDMKEISLDQWPDDEDFYFKGI